uniref:Transmembrane protein n=1 Tax=Panagrellus redivivus TaxID=6233 RepID=A0A7E4UW32_PANRE
MKRPNSFSKLALICDHSTNWPNFPLPTAFNTRNDSNSAIANTQVETTEDKLIKWQCPEDLKPFLRNETVAQTSFERYRDEDPNQLTGHLVKTEATKNDETKAAVFCSAIWIGIAIGASSTVTNLLFDPDVDVDHECVEYSSILIDGEVRSRFCRMKR